MNIAELKSNTVVNNETGCWIWQKAKTTGGYGETFHNGKVTYVHRLMYELWYGVQGNEIHHTCRNTICCNPEHLQAFETHAEHLTHENTGRKYNITRTHCPNGHEWTPENTFIRSDRNGRRECRQCRRDAQKRYKSK